MSERLLPLALHYADQVARLGSIQRTARESNVAASAIDRRILRLERDLGVPLFERLARGMRPSPAGEAVIALARQWRGDVRRLTDEIKAMKGISQGHVRIAAMDSHANGFLPSFIERLAREHPEITLDVEITTTDRAAAALLNGDVDCVVAFNLAPHRDLSVVAAAALPFGCIVAPGHPLARDASTTLQAAAAFPIILQSRGLVIRRYLEAKHGWLFAGRQPPVTTNSLQLLKMLARNGRYVAFTSELDAAAELIEGTLAFVPVRDAGAEAQGVSVATGARKPSRLVQYVAGALATELRECLARIRAVDANFAAREEIGAHGANT